MPIEGSRGTCRQMSLMQGKHSRENAHNNGILSMHNCTWNIV